MDFEQYNGIFEVIAVVLGSVVILINIILIVAAHKRKTLSLGVFGEKKDPLVVLWHNRLVDVVRDPSYPTRNAELLFRAIARNQWEELIATLRPFTWRSRYWYKGFGSCKVRCFRKTPRKPYGDEGETETVESFAVYMDELRAEGWEVTPTEDGKAFFAQLGMPLVKTPSKN